MFITCCAVSSATSWVLVSLTERVPSSAISKVVISTLITPKVSAEAICKEYNLLSTYSFTWSDFQYSDKSNSAKLVVPISSHLPSINKYS